MVHVLVFAHGRVSAGALDGAPASIERRFDPYMAHGLEWELSVNVVCRGITANSVANGRKQD